MKLIFDSTGLETDFSELNDPVAFVHKIKKREISIEEARFKQKEFSRYLKKNKDWKNNNKDKNSWLEK